MSSFAFICCHWQHWLSHGVALLTTPTKYVCHCYQFDFNRLCLKHGMCMTFCDITNCVRTINWSFWQMHVCVETLNVTLRQLSLCKQEGNMSLKKEVCDCHAIGSKLLSSLGFALLQLVDRHEQRPSPCFCQWMTSLLCFINAKHFAFRLVLWPLLWPSDPCQTFLKLMATGLDCSEMWNIKLNFTKQITMHWFAC